MIEWRLSVNAFSNTIINEKKVESLMYLLFKIDWNKLTTLKTNEIKNKS